MDLTGFVPLNSPEANAPTSAPTTTNSDVLIGLANKDLNDPWYSKVMSYLNAPGKAMANAGKQIVQSYEDNPNMTPAQNLVREGIQKTAGGTIGSIGNIIQPANFAKGVGSALQELLAPLNYLYTGQDTPAQQALQASRKSFAAGNAGQGLDQLNEGVMGMAGGVALAGGGLEGLAKPIEAVGTDAADASALTPASGNAVDALLKYQSSPDPGAWQALKESSQGLSSSLPEDAFAPSEEIVKFNRKIKNGDLDPEDPATQSQAAHLAEQQQAKISNFQNSLPKYEQIAQDSMMTNGQPNPNVPGTLEKAGDNIFENWKIMKDKLNQAGKQVEAVAEKHGETPIPLGDCFQNFDNSISKKLNIEFNDKGEPYAARGSSPMADEGLTAIKKARNMAQKLESGGQTPALTDVIATKRALSDLLPENQTSSGAVKAVNPKYSRAETAIVQLIKGLDDQISQAAEYEPKLAEVKKANMTYSRLAEAKAQMQTLFKANQANPELVLDDATFEANPDLHNGSAVVKKLWSPDAAKARTILQNIQKYTGQDMVSDAYAARVAGKAVGDYRWDSLLENTRGSGATSSWMDSKGGVMAPLKATARVATKAVKATTKALTSKEGVFNQGIEARKNLLKQIQ